MKEDIVVCMFVSMSVAALLVHASGENTFDL